MRDGKACPFCQFLHGLYGQVGTDCPVSTEDNGHDDEESEVLLAKSGESKENQPICRSCLLYLNVSGGEKGTAFCDLIKSNKENIDDEGNKKKCHNLGETLSKYFFYTGGYRVLSVIRIDYGCGKIKSVLQSCKDGTEVGYEAAGAGTQNQHTDNRL